MVLCTLDKNTMQQRLELQFTEGETLSLFSIGPGTVHLTGKLLYLCFEATIWSNALDRLLHYAGRGARGQ